MFNGKCKEDEYNGQQKLLKAFTWVRNFTSYLYDINKIMQLWLNRIVRFKNKAYEITITQPELFYGNIKLNDNLCKTLYCFLESNIQIF